MASFSTAKYDGDSRTASSGGRSFSASSLSVGTGFGTSFNMIGLIQPLSDNRWLLGTGFQHGIGASTSLAQDERMKTTSIATTGNPAKVTTGGVTDDQYSVNSDGVATVLTQGGGHVFSAAVGVNDNSGTQAAYYNNPNAASQTLATIARIADAIGAAGKLWYVGNEFPRGNTLYSMESRTVTAGTCTAINTTAFKDGESFGAVGVVGLFAASAQRPLTKVASAPGQDQYTVTSLGVYVFGGTAPTTAFLTYNATPAGGLISTTTNIKIVNEWMQSSAANYVSTINGVNYGIPGLLYNRPWVRIVDTFNALLDTSSGATQLSLPGTMDNLQLHGTFLSGLKTAKAFKAKIDADYPAAVSQDQRPTRNNWYAAKGSGVGTTFTGTLPTTMRVGFTGANAPTLISINGVGIGRVDTTTGAITGTGITSGSYNFTTGVWTITFASATSMPSNAQLWFEQDIGNYDLVNLTAGTIGRNAVMNGLMEVFTAVGTNLSTTTGTSSISTVASSDVPYGYTLSNSALQTAITNGTATASVSSGTDADGFPVFYAEAQGYHTAATALQMGTGSMNNVSTRFTAGQYVAAGARVAYRKHSTAGRFYGTVGAQVLGTFNVTGGVNVNTSTGVQNATSMQTRFIDGGTAMYIDDTAIAEMGGTEVAFYRYSPLLDTTGVTFGTTQVNQFVTTAANVPFAYRIGFGRVQFRRRADVS